MHSTDLIHISPVLLVFVYVSVESYPIVYIISYMQAHVSNYHRHDDTGDFQHTRIPHVVFYNKTSLTSSIPTPTLTLQPLPNTSISRMVYQINGIT